MKHEGGYLGALVLSVGVRVGNQVISLLNNYLNEIPVLMQRVRHSLLLLWSCCSTAAAVVELTSKTKVQST